MHTIIRFLAVLGLASAHVIPGVCRIVFLQHRQPRRPEHTLSPHGKHRASSGPETADDFVTTAPSTTITSATFTGLQVDVETQANINQVEIELYHVFPIDSTFPPDGRVLTLHELAVG